MRLLEIFRSKSLAVRFGLIIFAILAAAQIVVGSWYVIRERLHLEDSFNKRFDHLGALLVGVSRQPLFSFDYTPLMPFLDEMGKDDEIVAVRVYDSNMNLVAQKVKAGGEPDGTVRDGGMFFFPGRIARQFDVLMGGQNLGKVEIVFSAADANRELLTLLIITPMFLGVLLLVVIFTVYKFFAKYVAAPVRSLNNGIEKVGGKDLTVYFETDRQDELGEMIRGFNYLVEALRTYMARLSSTAVDVTAAIRQMEEIFQKVGEGTNSQFESVERMRERISRMDLSQKDVFESAERAASLFQENLSSQLEIRASVTEIVSSTDDLFRSTDVAYSAVSDMSSSSRQIADSADELAKTIEETSASVEQITSSIKLVEDHARQSAQVAAEVTMTANSTGMEAVRAARDGMMNIQQEVMSSSEIIQRLGTRSKDIEKILKVIKDVTEQTNLLSLNAAILAAQAGEYGKGFGVVADEIGSLAERTAMSTLEISNIVNTIQKEISEAVDSTSRGITRVDEGVSLVGRVEDALRQTLSNSEKASRMAYSIEKATVEQGNSIRHISKVVDRVQQMTKHVTLALKQQGNALNGLVSSAGTVRDVTEVVKKGMDEQNTGIQLISRNLELTNDMMSQVSEATFAQKKETEELIQDIVSIHAMGKRTLEIIDEMKETLTTLYSETENMQSEMKGFRLK
ncbi:MAG: HAMP domain-containing protein [Nitrospirae bacterium]|nr:HAMP domain-containing protein [Nitrospirota bacterium]